jgi:hypothetical protein
MKKFLQGTTLGGFVKEKKVKNNSERLTCVTKPPFPSLSPFSFFMFNK